MQTTITRFTAAVLIAGLLAPAAALAATAFFVTGPNFGENGPELRVTGIVAGLSEEDVTIVMEVQAFVTSVCTNPGGQPLPAAKQPAPTTMKATLDTGSMAVTNNAIDFNVATNFGTTIPGAPGCPSAKFTQTITDVSYDRAEITFFQESDPQLSFVNEF